MQWPIIRTLAKKEYFGFINSPLSFVIAVPFLILSMFIYLQTTLVVAEASLRPYIEMLPWYLIVLAPAISMKLLTDEQKNSTLDLLFAHPIRESDIVLGKFLGAFGFFLTIIGTTALLPISLLMFANPDIGVIITQYIGISFVGAMFLTLGLLASSFVTNPIGSFLIAASASFAFIIIGLDFVALVFPWPLSRVVEELALTAHMQNIARGLLDIRDVAYFITLTGLFLTGTILKLSERKIQEIPAEKQKLMLALGIIFGIGITANIVLSWYPLRIDLTQQKLFTVSKGTKQTIANLPDLITITLYASRNLPGPMQVTRKEVQDTLKDYQRLGKNIAVTILYPESDPDGAERAQREGIQEVTFNRVGSGKFEVQQGMLGLSIRYGEKTESIPFLSETDDLEYQISRRIRKLTQNTPQKIGMYQNSFQQYRQLEELVQSQYELSFLSIGDLTNEEKWKDLSSLIVIDDGASESTASSLLTQVAEKVKNVLVLTNGVTVSPQTLSATKGKNSLNEFLAEYGIQVNQDLVYDLQLNETLTFGSGQVRYLAPYPFWLRALPENSPLSLLSGIKSITMGWPSSLSLTEKEGVQLTRTLETSETGGKQTDAFAIDPTKTLSLPKPTKERIPLAVTAQKENTRLVVIANTQVAADQFLQGFEENATFLAQTIDYLSEDKDLAAIPRKTASRAVFRFTSPVQPVIFQYGNLLLPPVLVTTFALLWLSRRKKLQKRVYHQETV